ncbi:MAG: hypothetical protein IJ716_09805 [Lachnospiraceae bacterium]|nr:hypothetical protein [Lachnospiraceae bacterium]
MNMQKRQNKAWIDRLLTASVLLLFVIYLGIFFYLNMFKYTQHVDSDIAVDAMLAREIWEEKDLTPNNWISSTERLVVGVPMISSLFYAMTGSMVFSMGLSCVITGALLLTAIAYVFRRCHISATGICAALLALCALPINGLRNDGQMVPFVHLLWFLFADYYALHSICLFLCIAFYIRLRGNALSGKPVRLRGKEILIWLFLTGLCGGLALGGMRCLQVVILPLVVFEVLLLFTESGCMSQRLPSGRWIASAFLFSLLIVGILAKLYPTNVEYPMFIQDASGMVNRLVLQVPAAVLECLGIAGDCPLNSFAALMQLGTLAVLALTAWGFFFLFGFSQEGSHKKQRIDFSQKTLLLALCTSFLLTVVIETVTTAETAHNYFFVVWFVLITVLALLITWTGETAPWFTRLILGCICVFAVCNVLYTYKDCMTTTDNLQEYEEVISYMDSEELQYGYAEFWDASRICIMTDGRITMGHCYHMEDLHMYWWTTSTKWYVPSLPEAMRTAYVVCVEDKEAFEAQFEDPSVVRLGFENQRFAVYVSDHNLVSMN